MMKIIFTILSVLIGIAISWLLYQRQTKNYANGKIIASLRGLSTVLLLLLLVNWQFEKTTFKEIPPRLIWLQDASISVGDFVSKNEVTFNSNLNRTLDRLREKYEVITYSFGDSIKEINTQQFTLKDSSTNLSQAIHHLPNLLPINEQDKIVIATDGMYNVGGTPIISGIKSPLYAVQIGNAAPFPDFSVEKLYYNKKIQKGSLFEIQTEIVGKNIPNGTYQIQLLKGTQVLQEKSIQWESQQTIQYINFSSVTNTEGLQHYVIKLQAHPTEKNILNNQQDLYIDVVQHKPTITLAYATPHPNVAAIDEILQSLKDYKVEKVPTKSTASISTDILITHGLPASENKHQAQINIALPNLKISNKPMGIQLNNQFNVFDIEAVKTQNIQQIPLLESFNLETNPGQALITTKDNQAIWNIINKHTIHVNTFDIWRWKLFTYNEQTEQSLLKALLVQSISYIHTPNEIAFNISPNQASFSSNQSISFSGTYDNNSIVKKAILVLENEQKTWKDTFNLHLQNGNISVQIPQLSASNYTYYAQLISDKKTSTDRGGFKVNQAIIETGFEGVNSTFFDNARAWNPDLKSYTWDKVQLLEEDLLKDEAVQSTLSPEYHKKKLIDIPYYLIAILVCLTLEWFLRKKAGII